MLNQVRTILTAPTFPDDEDKTRKARYANAIALAFVGIACAYEIIIRIFMSYHDLSPIDFMIFGLALVCVVALALMRRGHVFTSSILLVVLIWGVTNSIAATGYGAQDASYLINFTIVLMAGLLLNWQASFIVTVLSILSGFGLAYAEQNGLISHTPYPITAFAWNIALVFGFNAVIIYLLINGLENALRKSRGSLEKLESTNLDLNRTQIELQNLTTELTVANQQLQNRTEKLRAIAAITATAASINDFEKLISSIASIISQQLGYYHVGVFLLDEEKQYVILRSASSERGLHLLENGHRLMMGQKGAVGFAAHTGQPQLALETEPTKGLLIATDFPATRSELALSLKYGDQIIGVLDLHSTEPNAFTSEDISTLNILADQVGIAIQNSLIYEQSQRALHEANLAFLHASQREWKGYSDVIQNRGYRYDGIKPEPLKESQSANEEESALLIPVQLRGQTIGQLKLKPSDSKKQWTEDEIAITKATAERAALAMEGARLLEEAQKRAAREAFLSDIAAKLGTSFQLDSILRDTVEELGQAMHGSIVSFQLVNPSSPLDMEPSMNHEPSARRNGSE